MIKKMKSKGITTISIEKIIDTNNIIHSLSVAPMLISAGMFMSTRNNIIINMCSYQIVNVMK